MFEAENSGGVAIGKLNLNRIVPYRVRALGRDAWLVHRQDRGRCSSLRLLLTLVVAQGAGAVIAQVGKIIAARMHVSPGDFDTFAGRDVHLDADGLLTNILRYWHSEFNPS